jgi:hypothetical protein
MGVRYFWPGVPSALPITRSQFHARLGTHFQLGQAVDPYLAFFKSATFKRWGIIGRANGRAYV